MSVLKNFKGRKVFVTGHTGFKGSWLCKWLDILGAKVKGFGLEPDTNPNHFSLLKLDREMESDIGDIRNLRALSRSIESFKPDIVFHLAAQSLVGHSYKDPIKTFETNTMGLVNLFEAMRSVPSIKAFINITSDKCYKNKDFYWGYRENDELGGEDPYSASKACAELITTCYRNSFFNIRDYGNKHNCLMATVRAGNIIGGGDWAHDRIVPDIMRSICKNKLLVVRRPNSVRPWQHVLGPLHGYLLLAEKLYCEEKQYSTSWNFGPNESAFSVQMLVEEVRKLWEFDYANDSGGAEFFETSFLSLDSGKARNLLGWRNIWNFQESVSLTVEWYKEFSTKKIVMTENNIKKYMSDNDAKM